MLEAVIVLSSSKIPFGSQGYKVPEALRASNDIAAVVAHAEILLMVIPTPFVAATMSTIRDSLRPEQVLTGIDRQGLMHCHGQAERMCFLAS